MRPILVLLLVLAAAGGFFFVLGKDKASPGGGGAAISGPDQPERTPTDDGPGETELVEVSSGNDRTDAGPQRVENEEPTTVAAAPKGSATVTGRIVDGSGNGLRIQPAAESRGGLRIHERARFHCVLLKSALRAAEPNGPVNRNNPRGCSFVCSVFFRNSELSFAIRNGC